MDLISDSSLKVSDGLFRDVNYYITGNVHQSIDGLLKNGGGKKHSYLSDMISHVIAGDGDNEEVSIAKELFQRPVVTSSWVVLSVECSHLLPTTIFDPDPSNQIFEGVAVCPSQLSSADNKLIWALVTCHGGKHQRVLNKTVTHLVTISTEGAKYDRVCTRSNSTVKVVTPDWILDCVESKTRQDERRYHPRLLSVPTSDGNLVPETNVSNLGEGVASLSLIAAGQQQSLTTEAGATFDSTFQSRMDVDTLPKQSSSSKSAKKKSSKFRPISTSSEFFDDSFKQSMSADNTMPQISSHLLSASSKPGRGHLKNIGNNTEVVAQISKSGKAGTSTKRTSIFDGNTSKQHTLQQSSSRQLAGGVNANGSIMPSKIFETVSSKVPVDSELRYYCGHDPVEHVPQDVCLLGCIFYIADYPKYIDPSVLEMWRQVIVQFGGQVDDSYSNRITHVLCEHQKSDVFQLALRDGKRLVTAHWLNDCLAVRKMEVPSQALHFPYIFGRERPASNQLICMTNFEGQERNQVKLMIAQIGAKYTGYMTRANSVVIAKYLGGVKCKKAIEWNIPVVGIQWLSDVILGELNALKLPLNPCYQIQNVQPNPAAPDLFHVDAAKVSYLLDGWKTPVKISKEAWKKFQSSQLIKLPKDSKAVPNSHISTLSKTAENTWLNNDVCSPEKRLRFSESQIVPVVLMTGIPEDEVIKLSRGIAKLGGQTVQSLQNTCTHLIANSALRTVKFLTALGVVRHIVTSEWVVQSIASNTFLDENAFSLRDENMELKFNFSLQTSLSRARQRSLFKDLTFYFTPSVQPSKKVLCEIVKSSGGKVVYKLPPLNHIVSKEEPTFVIISCDFDMYLLQEVQSHQVGIHNAEFVITGVMRQEVDFYTYRMN